MKMDVKNKKGFEFSFGWIFAIIVGAVIIFLAIYGVTNFIKQQRGTSDTFAGKEIGIILSPVETSLESGKTNMISFPAETRVYNDCKTTGNFGSQGIRVAMKSGVGKEWQEPGLPSIFYNKYIFSTSTVEGKKAMVLAKPFSMPYKVADIILLWSAEEDYCFVNPPKEIEDEIEDLSIERINVTSSKGNCKKNSKKVCFGSTGCDVDVDLISQRVKKYGQIIYYADDKENALLYGAIFSDPGIYECQVKRLMKRASELALLYRAKSESLSPRGCSSNLESDLITYSNQTSVFNSSIALNDIQYSADELGRRNNALSCKLF